MDSTSTPKRKMSSLSNEGDGGKRPKCSRSLLSGEEADQRGNTEGGEGTLMEGSQSLLSAEEADHRGNAGGGEVTLKKGPWTKEEDGILVDHINKYGEGNWKAVQKNSGLARCGKSCRLRWANHLRPGLKKGSFTAEEERQILEFHFLKGAKWAQMAAMLPGRTDNEIKNFWYTRSKKRKRAGLPIYPNEIFDSQESADTLANESSQPDEAKDFNWDITDLDLKDFKFCPAMLPPFFDTQDYKPIRDLLGPCSDPSHDTLSMRPSKCPRATVVQHRYLISSSNADVPVPEVFDQYGQYPMLSTPSDPILNTCLLNGYNNPTTGFHAASNVSSSEPIYGSMIPELPSFQNSENQPCTRSGMYVPFESVDMPVPASPDCSHLIDSTVYYNSDQNLKGSSIDSLQANTDSTAPIEADISTQWNGLDYDQRAALITRQQINFLRRVRHRRNFLRWVRPAIETTQCYDINRGAVNDQLPVPAYYTSNKEDNLNQRDLVLPDKVIDSGWYQV